MSGQNGVGTAPPFGQNMNSVFRNTMPGANSSSAPWWANTMHTMANQTMQQQARPFTPGPAVRAGQPMQFNPSMFQQNASGPQIQQVPLPQQQMNMMAPTPGYGAPQLSTTQYILNLQAQKAAEAAQVAKAGPLNSNSGYGQDGSCFVAGSLVFMADGSEKRIEQIKAGDQVLSANGKAATVQSLYRPKLGKRPLVAFDNGKCITSAEHSIWSRSPEGEQWWATRDLSQWQRESDNGEGPNFGGRSPFDLTNHYEEAWYFAHVSGWKSHKTLTLGAPADTQLYHLIVDGAKSYFVDGYLVSSMADVHTFDWHRFKWSGFSLMRRMWIKAKKIMNGD